METQKVLVHMFFIFYNEESLFLLSKKARVRFLFLLYEIIKK